MVIKVDSTFLLLRYVNDPNTKWNICIGVPYGISLWQVRDLCQQNGKFKTLLIKKKRQMFEKQMQTFCQYLHLLRTDIMVLVSKVWPEAFGNVANNLKAILERGWFALNKIL